MTQNGVTFIETLAAYASRKTILNIMDLERRYSILSKVAVTLLEKKFNLTKLTEQEELFRSCHNIYY